MDTVWIVVEPDYEGDHIKGVFSTRDAAENLVSQETMWEIQEWELDHEDWVRQFEKSSARHMASPWVNSHMARKSDLRRESRSFPGGTYSGYGASPEEAHEAWMRAINGLE